MVNFRKIFILKTTKHIARQLREVYFGKNWSGPYLQQIIQDVTWEESVTKVHNFNTIATLVFHMNYYPKGVSQYLNGKPLEIRDKYSFDHPPIQSKEDWELFLKDIFTSGEKFAQQIEKLPDSILNKTFYDKVYGTYARNLMGIIEHFHYHLGQIVIIKKLLK